jgi:hypothetical protein
MKNPKSFRLSGKACEALARFAADENMSEAKVIETLLTYGIPEHMLMAGDMYGGEGDKPGDFTWPAVMFNTRWNIMTDKHNKTRK